MKKISYGLGLVTVLNLFSCTVGPKYSITPELSFIGFSKSSMKQGNLNQDSVSLFINFKDGDGDIGSFENDSKINLFVIDNRTKSSYDNFKIPAIPLKGANNGVDGKITVNLYNTCCKFPENIPPCVVSSKYPSNELSLDIYLVDRAGNKSNVITTSKLQLICN
jgi:hypothetical protein